MRCITFCLFSVILCMALVVSAHADQTIPKKKQTTLGLYVTAKEAYNKWSASKGEIKILDVRTTGEYVFVGHAPMAFHIPIKFLDEGISEKTLKPNMSINHKFMDRVNDHFNKTDTIFVMCRSGARSAHAVNAMAKAGFTKIYNIVDGFEGGAITIAGSYNHGKRLVNGWINSGAPWTYSLNKNLVYTK